MTQSVGTIFPGFSLFAQFLWFSITVCQPIILALGPRWFFSPVRLLPPNFSLPCKGSPMFYPSTYGIIFEMILISHQNKVELLGKFKCSTIFPFWIYLCVKLLAMSIQKFWFYGRLLGELSHSFISIRILSVSIFIFYYVL